MASDATALRVAIGSQTDDKSVHAQALLKIILNASATERVELMSIAFQERDSVPKNTGHLPNKGIQQDRWDQLTKTHSEMVNGHLKMAFFKTTSVQDFAAELMRLIDFFQDEDEKTYIMAKALYSPYVPYHQLPGTPVHMTGTEYKHKLDSDPHRTQLIDYIMGLPFDERTERASMLLQVINDTDDESLRVALLAHANFIQEEILMEKMAEKIRGH